MRIKNSSGTALWMGYPFLLIAACFALIALSVESGVWLGLALIACALGLGRGALWWRKLSESELLVHRSSIVLARASTPCVQLEVREGDAVAVFPMSRWAPWQRFPSGTQLLVVPNGAALAEPVDTRRLIEIYLKASIVCRILGEVGFEVRELRSRGQLFG